MKVRHIYDTGGRHCIEVSVKKGEVIGPTIVAEDTVTRGNFELYDHMATHPDGFAAVTDYYAAAIIGGRDDVPEGGVVWRIMPMPFEDGFVYTDEENKELSDPAKKLEELTEKWESVNSRYRVTVPVHPLIKKWIGDNSRNDDEQCVKA